MACTIAADLKHFPDASDVVRVGSARWTGQHTFIMEALCDGVQRFLRTRRRLGLKQLKREYERFEPCAEVDGQRVRLMYGRDGALFREGSQLKIDIKGLVYIKPESTGS